MLLEVFGIVLIYFKLAGFVKVQTNCLYLKHWPPKSHQHTSSIPFKSVIFF